MIIHIVEPVGGMGLGVRLGKEFFDFFHTLGGRQLLAKFIAVNTDNGPDAIAAAKEFCRLVNHYLEYESLRKSMLLRCCDHSVQLGAREALRYIKSHNEKLRRLIKAIRSSKNRREFFRREQEMRQQTATEPPVLDCETRWGSTHQMDTDALKKKKALQATAQNADLFADLEKRGVDVDFVLTNAEWRDIAEISEFLAPVRHVMERTGRSSDTSINELGAGVAYLLHHCDEYTQKRGFDGEPTFLAEAAAAMKQKLQSYEKHLKSEAAAIGQFLDPAQRKVDSHELENLKSKVRGILVSDYGYSAVQQEERPVSSGAATSADTWRKVLEFQRVDNAPINAAQQDEVERFSGVLLDDPTSFGLQWWYNNRKNYPFLYKMAMDYLGIPASSTSVERANSEAGREFSTHRMNLSSNMFLASMCSRSWSRNGIFPPSDRHQAALDLRSENAERLSDLLLSEGI